MLNSFITTYRLSNALAQSCPKDPGFGVVAVTDTRLVADLAYVREVVAGFSYDGEGEGNWARALDAIRSPEFAPKLEELRKHGSLFAGVLDGREFLELKRL